jgi:peptide/nickel transport system permease protein
MAHYAGRRLILAIPVLWAATLIVFVAIRLVPGEVLLTGVDVGPIDDTVRARMIHDLGLDIPAPLQYLRWLGGILHGDFGLSLVSHQAVLPEIARRIPVSAEIALLSVVFGTLIALPLGAVSAIKQDTPLDYIARLLSIIWISVPNFVIGTIIILVPAILWRYAAPPGYASFFEDPVQNLQKVLPAALALGAALSGVLMRMTRSTMLDVLRNDYVRTARAKGVTEERVVSQHALKNALIPVVTIAGGQLGALLGGTVIVEALFGIPGLGTMANSALTTKDYPVLQGLTLFFATVYVLANLGVDLLYGWLDPRIRYS